MEADQSGYTQGNRSSPHLASDLFALLLLQERVGTNPATSSHQKLYVILPYQGLAEYTSQKGLKLLRVKTIIQ